MIETGRYKRKLLTKKFQLLCSECGKWFFAADSKEFNDEVGFPHWGYPVCPRCGKDNINAKFLYQTAKYYPRYIREDQMYLIRRLQQC